MARKKSNGNGADENGSKRSKRKSKSNGHASAAPAVNGDVIGREMRIARVAMTDADADEMKKRRKGLMAKKRELESGFTAFRKWATPRIRRSEDPEFNAAELEGEAPLDDVETRALAEELEHRRAEKTAAIAKIKAGLKLIRHALANGYQHRVVECERRVNVDRLTVEIVDPSTNAVVDERGMTDSERQMTLPGDELPGANGANGHAPDAVMM
jgi:hypothetical protein